MKRAIDWLAVDMVCQGVKMDLTADEKRMVIRRLSAKMLTYRENRDDYWSPKTAAKITAGQVAERMHATERTVWRYHGQLPPAEQRDCPVCREPMWVRLCDNVVEPHPDRIFEQCPMSGERLGVLRGLASIRPDLYGWAAS